MLNSRIFISYRHADSAAYAGRLYDRFKDRYGDEQVFRDLEMDFGIDFVERIEDTVGSCVVMVVVIGPGWLNARDAAGNRRLDDADDYVRVEISSALRRSTRVIPVLVGEAEMPDKNDLPDALRALARRNALPISDSRWDYDVSRLMQTVDRVLQEREAQIATQRSPMDEASNSVVTQAPPSPTPATPRASPTPETRGPERESVPPPASSSPPHSPQQLTPIGVPPPRSVEPTVRSWPLRPALTAVVAAALAAGPAFLLARHWVYGSFDLHKSSPSWEQAVRRASYQGAYWALIAAAVAVCVAVATRHRTPARALLKGLVVGAVVGTLAGALDQELTKALHPNAPHLGKVHAEGFLVSLTLVGGALGASGVIGRRGLTAAAGGLSGGALAGLLATQIDTAFAGLLTAAVLIVAGIWAPELLRLRTAVPLASGQPVTTERRGDPD